jgi:hypothetical protein
MLFGLTWLALSAAVGLFASERRNRSGFGWFLIAVVTSPLIGFVLCAILHEKTDIQIGPRSIPRARIAKWTH